MNQQIKKGEYEAFSALEKLLLTNPNLDFVFVL